MTSATLSGQAGEEHIDFADMRRGGASGRFSLDQLAISLSGMTSTLTQPSRCISLVHSSPTPTQSYSNLMLHCCLRRVSWFGRWGDGCSVTWLIITGDAEL